MATNASYATERTKRVLFVSYIFPPMLAGGVHRVAQTCKYLPEFGWSPTVLTAPAPNLASSNEQLLAELSEQTSVHRAYCPLQRGGVLNQPHRQEDLVGWFRACQRKIARLAFWPDWQVTWYPWAIRQGRRLLKEQAFDAVLATYGPATNLGVAARLARLGGLPLVLDFRDLWAGNPLAKYPTPLHRWACQTWERRWVAQARQVVAVSPSMAAWFADTYQLPPGKVSCVTNGFDPEDLRRARDDRPAPGQHDAQPFRLLFAGSVYGNVHFTSLLEAMRELSAEGKLSPATFRLQFVGNMTIDEPRRLGVEDFVELHPPAPHKKVFDFFAQSDALLLVEMVGYHAQFSYGSKLFDYMLAGKPILGLTEEGDMTARVVRQLGGQVVHPHDKQQIRAALLRLVEPPRPEFQPVDIEREPWRSFNRRYLTERLAAALDRALRQTADAASKANPPARNADREPCELGASP